MDGAAAGAANHAGAAGPCGRRSERTGSMDEAGPGPARQNDAAPRETGPAPPPAETAGRNGTKTGAGRHACRCPRLVSGVADKAVNLERKSRELSKTPENRVTPAVQNLVSQVGRPYAAVRLPARSGLAHGHRDRRPFACACQVSAEARITGTPGKMAAPCAGGRNPSSARGPPPIRNSLSVQEARRCAAARHSAFSSTATGHPPGQGPGR